MEPVINIKNVSFNYKRKNILKNISMDVNQGEFLAFVGPNGSGKTTLMKILVGELTPDSGTITMLGTPLEDFNSWTRIGYISQEVKAFNPSFPATVKEIIGANLYSRLGFFKLLNREAKKEIDRVLDLVDMKEFKYRQLGSLSGGQKQRIFIARTLVNDPELILLDEPLVGVDGAAQDRFFRLINKLNRQLGITVIMISHDIHVISSEATRVVCFSGGHIFIHEADNFDYDNYHCDTVGENRFIPDHEHGAGDR